jgi:flagellar basal body P-ring protein FlgI
MSKLIGFLVALGVISSFVPQVNEKMTEYYNDAIDSAVVASTSYSITETQRDLHMCRILNQCNNITLPSNPLFNDVVIDEREGIVLVEINFMDRHYRIEYKMVDEGRSISWDKKVEIV